MENVYNYINEPVNIRQKHINLKNNCVERGGNSTQCRALLAYYLDTNIPVGNKIHCCHACHNENCNEPTHLYWGTSAENRKDFLENCNKEYFFNLSKNMKGEKNPNYATKPWNSNNASSKTIDDWKKAQLIFEETKNVDFSKYGKGPSFLMQKYLINTGPAKCMIKMLRNNWIPEKDPDWVKLKES